MEGKSINTTSGAVSSGSMVKSFVLHILVLALLMLVPAKALLRSDPNKKDKDTDVEIVFHRSPLIEVPAAAPPLPLPKGTAAVGLPPGAPAPAAHPKPNAPDGPDAPGKPDLPPGPVESVPVKEKVGKVGILAFKDKIASLAQDKVAPRLGADARYAAADDVGRQSGRSILASSTPGSSGGINVNSLNRSVGGGGGGGGGGGTGTGGRGGNGGGGDGGGGIQVARATSSINAIGGDSRPKARSGPGAARTDEEIQIVFDRYKSSFYRLYNRELRNNPALKGQMVVRLTIEPDGSVSMCVLQSSDMDAPDLASQVVSRVKTMNFGAKEGVQAVTIAYPIDFLPAA
jgi:hypothetical protein